VRDVVANRWVAAIVLFLLLFSLVAYECARLAPTYVSVGRVIAAGRWVLVILFACVVVARFVEFRV